MSFKIGQLRKNQLNINEYQISKEADLQTGVISATQSIDGKNIQIMEFNEGGFSYPFKEGVTYYLNFSYTQQGSGPVNTVYLKLLSEDGTKEMIIKQRSGGGGSSEIIFTPNRDYQYFMVQIKRDKASLRVEDLYYKISSISNFYELKNILQADSFKNKFSEVVSIKKLGIQAPEGLIFALNGKDFKVGKSGIYTVSDVEIDHLCFYLKKANTDLYPYQNQTEQFFIMDFEY